MKCRAPAFLCADALDLPFGPNSFNTILSLNLIHSLPGIGALPACAKRVAARDAEMFFKATKCDRSTVGSAETENFEPWAT